MIFTYPLTSLFGCCCYLPHVTLRQSAKLSKPIFLSLCSSFKYNSVRSAWHMRQRALKKEIIKDASLTAILHCPETIN